MTLRSPNAAANTPPNRAFDGQNWRADVCALVSDAGEQVERVKYASYGMPTCVPAGDVDADAQNVEDYTQIATWAGASYYAAAGDLNLDGAVDAADVTLATAQDGTTGGRGVLSRLDTLNRKGYAGYENDGVLADSDTALPSCARFWHVRHRVLDSSMGRWTRRDPIGYVDGPSLLQYVNDEPIIHTDSQGTTLACVGCGICLTAAAVSCAILCGDQPWWDRPGEGFGHCMFKCAGAAISLPSVSIRRWIKTRVEPDLGEITASACGWICTRGCILKRIKGQYDEFVNPPGTELSPVWGLR